MLNINIIDYIYSDFVINYEFIFQFNYFIIVEQIVRHFSNQQKIR